MAWLALLSALWGSSYILIKIALLAIPPLTLIATRVTLAAAFLVAVVYFKGERLPWRLTTWRILLVQAFFNSIASWTILAWGQQYVESSLAAVLNSTSPIFVFFITLLLRRHEPAKLHRLSGALLGAVGVTTIVGVGTLRGFGHHVAGEVAILSSAALYACAAIYGNRLSSIPVTVSAAGTMIWATILLVPFSLAFDKPWMLNPSAASIAAVITLGVLCTGAALLIYFRLVRTIGPMGVASNSYLRAGVLGAAFLDEQLTATVWIGLAAVLIGVVLINRRNDARVAKTR